FPDTFLTYHEPEIGAATVEVLRRLHRVPVPGLVGKSRLMTQIGIPWPNDLRCCGRPLISNGLLSQAVAHARHNVERLFPWAHDSGQPIIGCEPSCILTIKDDYPALLRGEERARAEIVARACLTFEEYLDDLLTTGPAKTPFRPGPKRILVQGHCHQRSLTGMETTLRLPRHIPGAEGVDLDA